MSNTRPGYCPGCGGRLEPVDPPAIQQCEDCGEYEFFNPIPTSRVAVLDDEGVLLVKVDLPDRDLWGTPGGMAKVSEDPDVAGAR